MVLPNILNVQIQTHTRCNADCMFCPHVEGWHAKNPGVMDDALWEKVLTDLKPFSAGLSQGKVCLYNFEEPLLDRTIFEKTERVYQEFPDTMVELSTNCAALNDRNADRLIDAFAGRKHALWISHHGVDKQSLEHIMRLDYDICLKNIISLLKKAEGRLSIKIRGAGESRDGRFSFFTRDDYLAYWAKIFKDNSLSRKGVNIDAFTFHDRAGSLTREDRNAGAMKVGRVRELGPGHPPFHCRRLDSWLHINYDGRLCICCMDYHMEVPLPSLREMTLVEYYNSPHYLELVEKVTGARESEEDFICKRCISPGG